MLINKLNPNTKLGYIFVSQLSLLLQKGKDCEVCSRDISQHKRHIKLNNSYANIALREILFRELQRNNSLESFQRDALESGNAGKYVDNYISQHRGSLASLAEDYKIPLNKNLTWDKLTYIKVMEVTLTTVTEVSHEGNPE